MRGSILQRIRALESKPFDAHVLRAARAGFIETGESPNNPRLRQDVEDWDRLVTALRRTVPDPSKPRASTPRPDPFVPPRWNTLRPHQAQSDLWRSDARFCVAACGRRAGKSELAKRHLVLSALTATQPDAWYVAAAPTWGQARRVYWSDLQALAPKSEVDRVIASELTIRFINGAEISVLGMDVPQRIEGKALSGIVLDEHSDMGPYTWAENVRPALATAGREGWAWIIGTPSGLDHYHSLWLTAQKNDGGEWAAFHWKSADILDEKEIASAKRMMDPRSFEIEFEASFKGLSRRAFYCFDAARNVAPLTLDPGRELHFFFDWNCEPGSSCIGQEFERTVPVCDDTGGPKTDPQGNPIVTVESFTGILDEVHVMRDSTTPKICGELIERYGTHKAPILCWGDPTGGARGSSRVDGSDIDLVRDILGRHFGDRLELHFENRSPRERVRVNSLNARLRGADGKVRMLIDPRCEQLIADLDGMGLRDDGSLDKRYLERGHWADSVSYYTAARWGAARNSWTVSDLYGEVIEQSGNDCY